MKREREERIDSFLSQSKRGPSELKASQSRVVPSQPTEFLRQRLTFFRFWL